MGEIWYLHTALHSGSIIIEHRRICLTLATRHGIYSILEHC